MAWASLKRNKTFKYGVPMLILIVGGSFGLKEFAQIRYDASKNKGRMDPKLLAQLKEKESVSLEKEYEKLKEAEADAWVNIRGPRPWEDSRTVQDAQRKEIQKQP
ncbi:cytochrome c oxidase assembly protein COX16 homolog, mitochondrial [Lampetra fluviatilis]